MKNTLVNVVTMQTALSNKEFRLGFADWAHSKGWNEQHTVRGQWNYERGRLFALWLQKRGIDPKTFKLKSGRWASRETIHYFRYAMADGAVF